MTSSTTADDNLGRHVPESAVMILEELTRVNPSTVTRAQLTVCEFYDGNPSAADEVLCQLGIRRWFR